MLELIPLRQLTETRQLNLRARETASTCAVKTALYILDILLDRLKIKLSEVIVLLAYHQQSVRVQKLLELVPSKIKYLLYVPAV